MAKSPKQALRKPESGRDRKVVVDATEALSVVQSGMRLLVGGFGLCGIPEKLLATLAHLPAGDLEVVSNNCGVDNFGLGWLLEAHKLRRITASYVGENREFERQLLAGDIDVSLTPQGTLAERLRAGGSGLAAFYTPTGVGTSYAEGKETRAFGGKTYLLEEALRGDVALIKAEIGDRAGNLVYRGTARNFNPLCAMAADYTIAEVETLVDEGSLDPDSVHTPGIFVDAILHSPGEKRIERLKEQMPEGT